MMYTKPQITTLNKAVEAIQSDTVKAIHQVYDNAMQTTKGASAAYEADE